MIQAGVNKGAVVLDFGARSAAAACLSRERRGKTVTVGTGPTNLFLKKISAYRCRAQSKMSSLQLFNLHPPINFAARCCFRLFLVT
jgi:hypothetical protein